MSSAAALPTLWVMIEELEAAGWKRKTATIWIAPDGGYHLGPYGAWKVMVGRR
jgi:hypothetical protein